MEVDLGAGYRLTDRSLSPGYYGVVCLAEETGEAWRVEELSGEMLDDVAVLVLMLLMEGKLTAAAAEVFNAWAKGRVVVFGVG